MDKVLLFNPEKCCGCRTCELVCSFNRTGLLNPYLSCIKRITLADDLYFVPMTCLQCEEPLCLEACPAGAISKDEAGVVRVDQWRCIGCKMCVLACPFGNIVVRERSFKCERCDGDPQCVKGCPNKALVYVKKGEAGYARLSQTAQKLQDLYKRGEQL